MDAARKRLVRSTTGARLVRQREGLDALHASTGATCEALARRASAVLREIASARASLDAIESCLRTMTAHRDARESPPAELVLLADWLASGSMANRETFTLEEACTDGLQFAADGLTRSIQTQVGICLRRLGCERVERRTIAPRFVYKRPRRNAASSQAAGPASAEFQEVPV